LIQYRSVTDTHTQTDRQTDRHTTTAYTALSKASRGKISSVVVEIFGEIGRFLPYPFKSTNFSHLNLWRYWTKVHHICTQCREIICAIKLLIHIAIFYSVLKYQGAEWRSFRQFLPKIGCHGNVPWEIEKNWSGLITFTQITSIWW